MDVVVVTVLKESTLGCVLFKEFKPPPSSKSAPEKASVENLSLLNSTLSVVPSGVCWSVPEINEDTC